MKIAKQISAGETAQTQTSPIFLTSRKFSARELEIIYLIIEGQSNPAIAASLYLSESTVKTHIRNIMNKLGVDCRVQIAVAALRLGLA